ncbi:unnamed protein product [marine sediment metagenome]|uniref:Uncharacterized protein n=1 Tax=marine sediment metagenome TaxID=412755 RepID=X0TJ23_9ZZZZ
MWRPKKEIWDKIVWDNVSRVGGFFNGDTPVMIEGDRLLFEAGADAMLEGLIKNMPVRFVRTGEVISLGKAETFETTTEGWLVFIPEEE